MTTLLHIILNAVVWMIGLDGAGLPLHAALKPQNQQKSVTALSSVFTSAVIAFPTQVVNKP